MATGKITEIKQIRLSMGYSIREMARDLGIHPATYQRYDEGTAQTPLEILLSAELSREKDLNFMAGIFQRVDAHQGDYCPNEATAWGE
jgi:transcriptional regulator with XRE-family HTH domain